MRNDPILDELRAFRDAHAKKFNYDMKAICADLHRFSAKLKKQGVKFSRPKQRRPRARKVAA